MPWHVFLSLTWLVNRKFKDGLCIPGLCPSAQAAASPRPQLTVSIAQLGRQGLTFFSGCPPDLHLAVITPCEFLLDFYKPSSNSFLSGRRRPSLQLSPAAIGPCEFLFDFCEPSCHPMHVATIPRSMFLIDVSAVVLIDYAQVPY